MRPRADEVKVRNHIVAVVGAEPGALPEDRLETERAAEVCGQVAAEIGGRVVETCDDIGAEAGRHAAFDLIQYGVGESLAEVAVPFGFRLAQMRDRRERVEGRVPRRGHAGVGDARRIGRAAGRARGSQYV